MTQAIRFDFIKHDYSVRADATLQQQEKAPSKRGKTDAIIKELFACKASVQPLEKNYELALFTRQLSNHVEASLKRRYSIFSWFIIVIGKTFGIGPLSRLDALEHHFSLACNNQKQALMLKLIKGDAHDIPKLLASIFLVDPAATTGNAKIDALYRRIQKPGIFSASDSVQLAWYIEHHAPLSGYTKKDTAKGLPKTLHTDASTGRMFISQKGNKQLPIAATKVKKVTKALMLDPKSDQAQIVAQLTTRDSLSAHMRQVTLAEFGTVQEYKNQPGIWPLFHAAEYIKHKDTTEITKVALFAPLGEDTFSNIAGSLAFEEFVHVTYTLLEGLKTIHASGAVHADIKGANALVTTNNDGPANVGWIDFGLSGKITDERLIAHFKLGFYGTLKFTAPELFGVRGFCADHAKTDMWAFGLMLYRAYFQKDPSWFALNLIPEKREGIDYQKKEAYKNAIQAEIELALNELFKKESKTRVDQFEMLIYKLLLPDPKKRLSAQEALREHGAL